MPAFAGLREVNIVDLNKVVHANLLAIFQNDKFFLVGHLGIQYSGLNQVHLIHLIAILDIDYGFVHGEYLDVIVDIAGNGLVVGFHKWKTAKGSIKLKCERRTAIFDRTY